MVELLLNFCESNPALSGLIVFWLPWPAAFAVCGVADVVAVLLVRLWTRALRAACILAHGWPSAVSDADWHSKKF